MYFIYPISLFCAEMCPSIPIVLTFCGSDKNLARIVVTFFCLARVWFNSPFEAPLGGRGRLAIAQIHFFVVDFPLVRVYIATSESSSAVLGGGAGQQYVANVSV